MIVALVENDMHPLHAAFPPPQSNLTYFTAWTFSVRFVVSTGQSCTREAKGLARSANMANSVWLLFFYYYRSSLKPN